MSSWTVEAGVVHPDSNTDGHYTLGDIEVIAGTSSTGYPHSNGFDTEAEATAWAIDQMTDYGKYIAWTPSIAHGVTYGEAGYTLYDIVDTSTGETLQTEAIRVYEVPDMVVHIRRTRHERDSRESLADCYCGSSPYTISVFDTTTTYDDAEAHHFADYCPLCCAVIAIEDVVMRGTDTIALFRSEGEPGYIEGATVPAGHIDECESDDEQVNDIVNAAIRAACDVLDLSWTCNGDLRGLCGQRLPANYLALLEDLSREAFESACAEVAFKFE